ncbi:MAG: hypothetical protein JNM00_14610 [Flavobacteriales bacterium]|nr:hypothetical protein [Flavobacteriales bacterium]
MFKATIISLGFLSLFLDSVSQITPPYFNQFNEPEDEDGWIHYANIGTDDWLLGVPTNGVYNSAYSDPWAWYTSAGSTAATVSLRFLESPSFDLTNTTEPLVLGFWNKRDYTPNVNFWMEYTTDGGTTWITLDNDPARKLNWSFNVDANNFVYSCVSLDFLMGQPAVKFRYKFGTSVNTTLGWIIDDFSIDVEHYDFNALNGDTLEIFSTCEEWLLDVAFNFENQFAQYTAINVDFYLSLDNVLDASDQLLVSDDMNLAFDYGNLTYEIAPVPLSAGTYHIIYVVDTNNNVEEDDETNNVGVIPMVLNAVTPLDYVDDFESENQLFGLFPDGTQNLVVWEHGQGYDFRTVGAHSGTNTWHASRELEGNGEVGFPESTIYQEIHTPTFDLSDPPPTLCMSFWFKLDRTNSATVAGVDIATIGGCQGELTTSFVTYPAEHHEGWRYFTKDITSSAIFSNNILKSYVFRASYNNDFNYEDFGMVIDDFYLGEIKADVGIEGEKNCGYVDQQSEEAVLNYELVNCGLLAAGPTTTSFFLSTDPYLDGDDTWLGDVSEESVTASTRTPRSFTYTKPAFTDDYYIIYVLDAQNQIDEMREYDNTGAFRISQYDVFATPYMNDFESQIDEWTHNSSLNEDEWNWSVVDGPVFDQAFSVEKAWLLGDSGRVHTWRLNHLYTPVFDLSDLSDPVLAFQMYHGYDNGIPDIDASRGIAVEYSVNGGTAWEAIEAVDGALNGLGKLDDYGIISQYTYQNKSTLNATQYYFDLSEIQGEETVQFRITAGVGNGDANTDTLITDGVMIDNFGVLEGNPDLVLQHRALMLSDLSDEVIFNTTLYNRGNQLAPGCVVKHYLSVDDQWDVDDIWLGEYNYGELEPDQLLRSNHVYPVPGALSDFQYLILALDPDNLIEELDESNNVDAWLLTDLVEDFPYIEDFNQPGPQGWNFEVEQYGTPVQFAHYISNIYVESTNGVNEEDDIDMPFQATAAPFFNSESGTPEYYLYSPPFNFSAYDSVQVSFELNMEAGPDEGVNFFYTLNNGANWFLFSTEDAPDAAGMVNWYSEDSPVGGDPFSGNIDWLNNQPGWSMSYGTLDVSANASSLRGNNNVIFRFFAKVSHDYNGNGEEGWGIDDFMIETFVADYCAADSMVSHVLANELQDSFELTIHAQNVGQTNGRLSRTYFYWSADDVLDAGDELAVFYDIPTIPPVDYFFTHEIPMPLTLPPGDVYLFYVLDGDDNLIEINESNNIGSFIVTIPSLINYVADSPQTLLADQNVTEIVTNYTVGNEGTLDGSATTTRYYWSEDDVFDGGDQLFATENQDGVPHLSSAPVLHSLEYPLPLQQQVYYMFYELDEGQLLDETDESDNAGVVLVDFYNYGILIGEQDNDRVRVYFNGESIQMVNLPPGPMNWKVYNNLGQELASGNVSVSLPRISLIPNNWSDNMVYMHISGENYHFVQPLLIVR